MKLNKKLVSLLLALTLLATTFMAAGCGCSNNGKQNGTTPAPLEVKKEEGDTGKTIKGKFTLRNVKYGYTPAAVKAYESKQKDTIEPPSEGKSKDGYIYLNYTFDDNHKPTFYGVTPGKHQEGAMLTYVFKKQKLNELRVQFGIIKDGDFNKLVNNIDKKYGQHTYYREYTNASKTYWWKTDKELLQVIKNNNSVNLYLRKN